MNTGHACPDFQMLFQECPDALLVTKPSLQIIVSNPAAQKLLGDSAKDLQGKNLGELLHAADKDALLAVIEAARRGDNPPARCYFRFQNPSGETVTLEILVRNLRIDPRHQQLLLSCHRVSKQNLKLEKVAELAYLDALTGLPNLRKFEEVLDRELRLRKRRSRPFSILLLDLDHLKHINDTLGHLAGNRAICKLAQVLRKQCRTTDTAGRFGGDEFYVVLPDTNTTEALFCADRIKSALGADQDFPGLSASIGIACYPADGTTAESLMAAADSELYRLKRARQPVEKQVEVSEGVAKSRFLSIHTAQLALSSS